jgi:hypothetical protein
MNTDTETLKAAVIEYIQQYLATYPLPTDAPVYFEITASNTSVSATPLNKEASVLKRIVSKHRRLENAFHDHGKTLEEVLSLPYDAIRKFRNIGDLSLFQLARDLAKEGFLFPWMERAFKNDPKYIADQKQFSQGIVRKLSVKEWDRMLSYVQQSNSVTNKAKLRVITTLQKLDNRPTLLRKLFVPSAHHYEYLSTISIINKRFEFCQLPYRIRVTPISNVGQAHEAHAQVVVV